MGEDHLLDAGILGQISETSLTRDTAIEMESSGLPNTFVPGRNLLFLTLAAALAYRRGLQVIVTGVCETDFSGYPDCRDDTMKAMQVALSLGMDRKLLIETPLMWIDKAQTWQLAHDVGQQADSAQGGQALVDLVVEHTHTCYLGDRTQRHRWGYGCGQCPACQLRAAGFARLSATPRLESGTFTIEAMKTLAYTRAQALPEILKTRIAILDGAMGTMIQRFKLAEADYRGERFKDFPKDVKGNNELLSLTRPDVIRDIHEGYLAAGADLIETNTFGATTVAQADYDMQHLAREMNLQSAKLARAACDKFSTPDKPRYVVGALGPTPKTASISPDVNDAGARNITFEELRAAYYEQVEALVEGGSDVLLVETIFDTLNAKAALFAIEEFFEASGERLPLIISGTVTDASGRILSGQTVTAFWHSVRHAQPLAIGLNCALGATLMRPYIQELNKVAGDTFISCYPNAGLPNPMSDTGFDETPDVTSRLLHEFAAEGLGQHRGRLLRHHA